MLHLFKFVMGLWFLTRLIVSIILHKPRDLEIYTYCYIGLKGTLNLNQMREPKTVVMGLSRIGTFPCYDYYSILYPEYGRISF